MFCPPTHTHQHCISELVWENSVALRRPASGFRTADPPPTLVLFPNDTSQRASRRPRLHSPTKAHESHSESCTAHSPRPLLPAVHEAAKTARAAHTALSAAAEPHAAPRPVPLHPPYGNLCPHAWRTHFLSSASLPAAATGFCRAACSGCSGTFLNRELCPPRVAARTEMGSGHQDQAIASEGGRMKDAPLERGPPAPVRPPSMALAARPDQWDPLPPGPEPGETVPHQLSQRGPRLAMQSPPVGARVMGRPIRLGPPALQGGLLGGQRGRPFPAEGHLGSWRTAENTGCCPGQTGAGEEGVGFCGRS